MDLPELKGRAITTLDASAAPPLWIFVLERGCSINVGCPWRVVRDGRVALAAQDHEQLFGRQEPVDVVKETLSLLDGKKVVRASIGHAGDLAVEFEGGTRIETFTDSCGYESLTVRLSDGKQWIVVGGGKVVEF